MGTSMAGGQASFHLPLSGIINSGSLLVYNYCFFNQFATLRWHGENSVADEARRAFH